MRTINKIFLGITLLTLISGVFGICKSSSSSNEAIVASADSKLEINSFKSIANGWNPNPTDLQNGYCHYVLEFQNNWISTGQAVKGENLRTVIGDKIFINSTPVNTIEPTSGKEIKIHYEHGGKYFAMKIPSFLLVNDPVKSTCTIEIEEGTPFYEWALPHLILTVNTDSYVATAKVIETPKPVYFDCFQWQNTLYNTTSNAGLLEPEFEPNPLLIDSGKNAVPQNGYLCLVGFSKQDSAYQCLPTDNFAYDENYEFLDKMFFNGVSVRNLVGIKVNNIMGFFYFYVPDASLQNKDKYKYLTVELKYGITIGSMILPDLKLEFRSTLGSRTGWVVIQSENSGIIWNKTNKNPDIFGDKKGLLVGCSMQMYNGTSDNLVSEIGSRVTLNDNTFTTLTNAEIRVYDSNKLWFYADEMNTLTKDKNTLKILTCSIFGLTIASFSYYCKSGENNFWSSKISDNPKKITLSESNLYYDSGIDCYGSAWASNHVYESTGVHRYCGGNYNSSEKNGFLLSFANRNLTTTDNKFINLSNEYKEYNGDLKYTNLCQEDIGHHIYSNGVPFCDIDGAEIMYHSQGNIWLWTPNLTEPYEGKNHAEITIEANTPFFDSILPEMHIIHTDCLDFNRISKLNLWHICGLSGKYAFEIPDDMNDPYLTLDERTDGGQGDTWLGPYTWNNHDGDGTTIIAFGTNAADPVDHPGDKPFETTYFNKTKTPVNYNMATMDFSIGYKLKLNGMPVAKIDGIECNYQNVENFFTMIIPERLCTAFNGYKVPTLTLEDGANFLEVSFEGFTIFFNNHKWQKAPIEYITDQEIIDSTDYEEVFDTKVLDSNVSEIEGSIPALASSFSFEFKSDFENAAFVMNLFGNSNEKGLSLFFDYNNKSLIVTDKTKTNKTIGSGSYELKADVGEWTRCYVSFILAGEYASVVVAIDDIVLIHEALVHIDDVEQLGQNAYAYANGTTINFRNSCPGSSIKCPNIVYIGKDIYRYHVGDYMRSIDSYFTAYDKFTNLTDRIVISYPNDMFDENERLKKGTFNIIASVSNDSGTTATKSVCVIVTDPSEAVVTFDGKNPEIYKIGALVNKPDYTPTKDPQGSTEYEFVGWVTSSGIEWDFERDYVTGDIDLISAFKEIVHTFVVTFNVTGDLSGTYTMSLSDGAVIKSSMFEKEGYSLLMKIDGVSYSSYKVDKAITVTLDYKKNVEPQPEPEKKGCGGSIITASIVLCLTSLAGIVLVLNKKKEDK